MIQSLKIKNFQSHEISELSFSQGMNVITGSSDSGKTAIIRALRWAVFNKPSGNSFMRTESKDTEVEVMFYDGSGVNRAKHGSSNTYTIEQETFTAFGVNVPDAVKAICNISDINLQQQLERPFLLDDSPGEVAAFFNRVANLDAIDTATKNIKKNIRKHSDAVNFHTSIISALEYTLKDFEHLDAMDKLVQEMEWIEKEQVKEQMRVSSLNSLCGKIQDVIEKEIEYQGLPELLEQIQKNMKEFEQQRQNLYALDSARTTLMEIEIQKIRYSKYVDAANTIDEIFILHQREKEQIQKLCDCTAIIKRLQFLERQTEDEKRSFENLQKRFTAAMPDICPLCGKPK